METGADPLSGLCGERCRRGSPFAEKTSAIDAWQPSRTCFARYLEVPVNRLWTIPTFSPAANHHVSQRLALGSVVAIRLLSWGNKGFRPLVGTPSAAGALWDYRKKPAYLEAVMDHVKDWSADRTDIIRKITRRLVPFVGLIYLIAYIDRQNVSFAKLQMVGDLGLSEAAYGLGASLFFLGYFLFEVPSNVILEMVGARRWFARIMISWGLVTIALAFTKNATMFYILRFLLGVSEAGFFPGVLYLLTIWFPHGYRARMVGSFMLYSAVANAIGAPIGGALLDLDGFLGLRGWEWVFLVTGIPAVAMGFVTLAYLDDRPETAHFLAADEKE